MSYHPSDPRFTYGPALQQGPNNSTLPYNQGQPVLMNPNQPNNPPPALRQPLQTGNARGSSRMPAIEPQKIDMMGEGMVRMGSAMGAQTGNGLNAGMAAAGQEYGNIMDYNRGAEAEAQALEEDRRVELQRRMDAQAAAQAKSSAPKPASDQDMQDMAAAAGKYQTAMEVLQGFKDRDYVVGWQSYLTELWDNVTDDPRQNIRLKLQTLKVDKILANVARTKGAISEKEMEIFASDQPSKLAGEEIWSNWVKDYAEALRVMNTHMRGGSTTGTYSDGSSSGSFNPTGQSPVDTSGYSIVN